MTGEQVNLLSSIVGLIGAGVGIWQWAKNNAHKEKDKELQNVLASLANLATMKQHSWSNSISVLFLEDHKGQHTINTEERLMTFRLAARARDDMKEIYTTAAALEGTLNNEESAILKNMQKQLEQAKLQNKIAEEIKKYPEDNSNKI